MTDPQLASRPAPWGLGRMRPFPPAAVLPYTEVVLDPATQQGLWIGPDGLPVVDAKHKRSETSKETSKQTSLDGNSDAGSDQEGDTD